MTAPSAIEKKAAYLREKFPQLTEAQVQLMARDLVASVGKSSGRRLRYFRTRKVSR